MQKEYQKETMQDCKKKIELFTIVYYNKSNALYLKQTKTAMDFVFIKEER